MSAPSAAFVSPWPSRKPADATSPNPGIQVAQQYQQHAAAVERYAFAICRSSAEAEDIAQECFVRWMQALDRGVAIERPLAWLLRVAHNLAVDYTSRRPREIGLPGQEDGEIASPAPTPEAALLEQDRRARVQQALALLSPQELRCWLLRAEGLRYREIAEIAGVQVGTVATFLVRAAEKLSSV